MAGAELVAAVLASGEEAGAPRKKLQHHRRSCLLAFGLAATGSDMSPDPASRPRLAATGSGDSSLTWSKKSNLLVDGRAASRGKVEASAVASRGKVEASAAMRQGGVRVQGGMRRREARGECGCEGGVQRVRVRVEYEICQGLFCKMSIARDISGQSEY